MFLRALQWLSTGLVTRSVKRLQLSSVYFCRFKRNADEQADNFHTEMQQSSVKQNLTLFECENLQSNN